MPDVIAERVKLWWWALLIGILASIEYLGRFQGGKPDRNILYAYSTAVASAVAYGVILLAVLGIAGRRRDLLAFRRPSSWPVAIGLAVLLLIGVYIAVALLDPVLHGSREQGLTPTSWQPSHAGAYAANFLVVAGVAPFVEELTFRGVGYSLLARYGRWTSILIVGACFALDHGLVQAFPELFIFGCALAWLRSKTTSVFPGMLLHATFNSIALVAAVAT
ncbi:MAG: type II CAAX endopeptidase family protein [Actinomycetes bacterium]